MNLAQFTKQLGIATGIEFDAEIMLPEERIRAFCAADKCGNYGRNYMCPPAIGGLEQIKIEIKKYRIGILLQYSQDLDVKNDREGVFAAQKEFHQKILQIEEFLKSKGIKRLWGMIGGNCRLCAVCGLQRGQPCQFPDQARTSLEAIGVDVFGLLNKFGLEGKFRPDKITWSGCILIQDPPGGRINNL